MHKSSAFESEYVKKTKKTIRGELRDLVRPGIRVSISQQAAARETLLGILSRAEWAGISASWVATHLGKVAHRRMGPTAPTLGIVTDVQFWESMWAEVRDLRAAVLRRETEELKAEATRGHGGVNNAVGTGASRPRTSLEQAIDAVAAYKRGETNTWKPGETGFPTAAEQIAHAMSTMKRRDERKFWRRFF